MAAHGLPVQSSIVNIQLLKAVLVKINSWLGRNPGEGVALVLNVTAAVYEDTRNQTHVVNKMAEEQIQGLRLTFRSVFLTTAREWKYMIVPVHSLRVRIVSPLFITFLLKLIDWWTPMFRKCQKRVVCQKVSETWRKALLEMLSPTWERNGRRVHIFDITNGFKNPESLLPLNFFISFFGKVLRLTPLFLHWLYRIERRRGDLKWKGLFYHHLCWACFKQTHNSIPKTWKSFILHTSFFSDAQLGNVVFKGFLTWLSGLCAVGKMNQLLA